MSPTMQMTAPPAMYAPMSDVLDRHDYGVSKNRKVASTGGGRAWSEDEEAYLLQTRLQKMPYKHIAAHLKKTELACRLHYHQLSHGSNRRKRTSSASSGSSTGGHSPLIGASIPSPIREYEGLMSRSASPLGSAGSYGPNSPNGLQLPRILAVDNNASPRLPAILPKPASMTLALANAVSAGSPTTARGYPTPLPEPHPHSAPLSAPSGFRATMTPTSAAPHSAHSVNGAPPHLHHLPGSLRLDCSALPPPTHGGMSDSSLSGPWSAGAGSVAQANLPVDMARLNAVYSAHRASFWAAVAADYGAGANPIVLEQAWRNGVVATSAPGAHHMSAQTPMTPVGSPDDHIYGTSHVAASRTGPSDKTRISAILGADTTARSPIERESVRGFEDERCAVGMVGA